MFLFLLLNIAMCSDSVWCVMRLAGQGIELPQLRCYHYPHAQAQSGASLLLIGGLGCTKEEAAAGAALCTATT